MMKMAALNARFTKASPTMFKIRRRIAVLKWRLFDECPLNVQRRPCLSPGLHRFGKGLEKPEE